MKRDARNLSGNSDLVRHPRERRSSIEHARNNSTSTQKPRNAHDFTIKDHVKNSLVWIKVDGSLQFSERDHSTVPLLTSLVVWDALDVPVDDVVAFAGHSLGQVTALIASGVLTLDDGVRFAARRGGKVRPAPCV